MPDFEVPDLLVVPPAVGPLVAEAEADGTYTLGWAAESGDAFAITLAGSDGTLVCFVEDDGAFTVPAADVAAAGADPLVLALRSAWGDVVASGVEVFGMASSGAVAE
jgi:hypothetical protein